MAPNSRSLIFGVSSKRQDRRGVRAGRQGDHPGSGNLHRHRSGLLQSRRGTQHGMEYLSEDRVEIRYTLPLAEIVFDFFDALKSRTRGRASLDYEPSGELAADLVKVDILLHGEPVTRFPQSCTRTRPTRMG